MADVTPVDYLSDFLPNFLLDPRKTALVMIDLQYASASREAGLGRFLKEQGKEDSARYRFERIEQVVVPNTRRLLEFFRGHGLRVIYVTLGTELPDYSDLPAHMKAFQMAARNLPGSREREELDEIKPLAGELIVHKTTAGAFNSSGFEARLRTLRVEQLAIAGVSTNSCVETTARDAADRGFDTLLVEDACGAGQPQLHEATLVSFRRLFGRVASTEDVLVELKRGL